jgi:hypothetical protein
MPIAFNCPNCGQDYKVPDEVAGRSTKCRKCATVIQIPLASQAAPPAAAAIQSTPSAPVPPVGPAAGGPGWREHAQRFGEQAAPLVGKVKGVPPKILLPVAAAVLLVFCLLPTFMVARWMFGGGSALGSGELYLPDDCKFIASVHVDKMLESPLFKELQNEFPDLRDEVNREGTKDKAKRVLVAGGFSDQQPLMIMELRAPVTVDEAKKSFKITEVAEEKYDNFTLYLFADPTDFGAREKTMAFCFPEKYVLLQGKVDKVKAVLKRNKKPELPKELQAALRQADMSASLTMVASLKGAPVPDGPAAEKMRAVADKVEHAILVVNMTTDLTMSATVHCTEAKAAEELRDLIKGFLAILKFAGLPKEANDLIDAVKIDVKGTDLVGNIQVKQDTITKGIKQMKGGR